MSDAPRLLSFPIFVIFISNLLLQWLHHLNHITFELFKSIIIQLLHYQVKLLTKKHKVKIHSLLVDAQKVFGVSQKVVLVVYNFDIVRIYGFHCILDLYVEW